MFTLKVATVIVAAVFGSVGVLNNNTIHDETKVSYRIVSVVSGSGGVLAP